ncbi:poly(R)-hydroxyalkanoic acid synthase subunit PhaE [Clostridium lundense]|uniref:poly(R)-hydroxyalkanoic acid synthase subunit PhaE n=1 Tax=Clostridium lundense TaxID=319475 RepID=UPI0004845472|nr:poly(R)-hydroxyalkanoic acid synthase subunit PhaE [Clostridium lundense]
MNFDNNMMNQFFDIQKNMIGAWQEIFLPKTDSKNETKTENSKNESSRNPMDFLNNMMEFNNKIFYSFNSGDPYEVLKKITSSANVYFNVYKLWEELNNKSFKPTIEEYNKIYDNWKDKYMEFLSNSFAPYLPKQMQCFVKEPMEIFNSYTNLINQSFKPWIETSNELKEYMAEGIFKSPADYLNFIKLWKDNYDKTFSKFLNSPALGINRELLEKQFEGLDTFIKYTTILGEFSATILSVAKETAEQIFKNYMEMMKNGTQPKTFKEFYEYWSKENENAYEKLFNTDDFSKLIAEVVDSSMKFKMKCDNLMEEYIGLMPIPTKSEMNSLYKTVYELKRELKNVKKELNEIKSVKK